MYLQTNRIEDAVVQIKPFSLDISGGPPPPATPDLQAQLVDERATVRALRERIALLEGLLAERGVTSI